MTTTSSQLSFEAICKQKGFDSTKTLFVVIDNEVSRFHLGEILKTSFVSVSYGLCEFVDKSIQGMEKTYSFTGIVVFTTLQSYIFKYVQNGIVHREDGPASITTGNGTNVLKWCHNNKLHNVDGPAHFVKHENKPVAVIDHYLHGEHIYSETYATQYLIKNLKEYVAPTIEDLLKLHQEEINIFDQMRYNDTRISTT